MERVSILILPANSTMKNRAMYVRDVTKTVFMFRTLFSRPFHVNAPLEEQIHNKTLYKIVRPVYGVLESLMHWYTQKSIQKRGKPDYVYRYLLAVWHMHVFATNNREITSNLIDIRKGIYLTSIET